MAYKRNYIQDMTLEEIIIAERDCTYVLGEVNRVLNNQRPDSIRATRITLSKTADKMIRNLDELRLKKDKKTKVHVPKGASFRGAYVRTNN